MSWSAFHSVRFQCQGQSFIIISDTSPPTVPHVNFPSYLSSSFPLAQLPDYSNRSMYGRYYSNSKIDYSLVTLPVPELPASPDSRRTPKLSVPDHNSCLPIHAAVCVSLLWPHFPASRSTAWPSVRFLCPAILPWGVVLPCTTQRNVITMRIFPVHEFLIVCSLLESKRSKLPPLWESDTFAVAIYLRRE